MPGSRGIHQKILIWYYKKVAIDGQRNRTDNIFYHFDHFEHVFATHMRHHGKFEYLKPLYISILPMAPRPRKLLYLLSAGKQQTQRELILSVEALISQDNEGLSRSVQVKKLSTVTAEAFAACATTTRQVAVRSYCDFRYDTSTQARSSKEAWLQFERTLLRRSRIK